MLSPLSPRCPTRAVDILRNHSLGLDSKTVEYLLLIVVRTGFEPVILRRAFSYRLFHYTFDIVYPIPTPDYLVLLLSLLPYKL